MRWEGVDDSEGRRSGVMYFHYSPEGFFQSDHQIIIMINLID